MSTTTPFARDAYDVVVIGGGPAGATTATIAAEAGHSVLQLEREAFPRFSIGESLIPATHDVLARLGMIDTLRQSAFVQKHSVQFIGETGKASAPFYFHETDPSPRSQTWQVVRSEFDQMMLDNARARGVEIHDQTAVQSVLFEDGEPSVEGRAVGVRVKCADGTRANVPARVVVDASGRRSVLARALGIRHQDPNLRMAAIFTHFKGAHRDEGIDEGATLIIHTEGQEGWVWYIPLPNDTVSVGVVGPISHMIAGRQGDPQAVFDEEIARCPGVQPKLAGARQARDVQVLNDFSYRSCPAAGNGWQLVGDALGFLDPMYSTGVLLALKSGEMAGDALVAALAADDPSAKRLSTYGRTINAGMEAFRRLVYAFYDKRFSFADFLRHYPDHRLAIIDILVGDVFERDFDPLFADMERMMPGFRPGGGRDVPAAAGMAVESA